jgi:uracil-DNA glycosylase family 4
MARIRDEFIAEYGWEPPAGWTPGPVLKPEACKGCPMYGASKYMVPDEIHPNSELFIHMQNPGKDEELAGIPACGKTGVVLNERYIPLTGLSRGPSISVGNVLRCRLGSSNDLPTGATLSGVSGAVEHCTRAYEQIPKSTKAIIVQGDLAFTHYTQGRLRGSLTQWRGFLLPAMPLPTFVTTHTAHTFHDPQAAFAAVIDWRHIGALREVGWQQPQPPPQVTMPLDYVSEDADILLNGVIESLAIDTEYHEDFLTIIGIGVRNKEFMAVLSVDWQHSTWQVRNWLKLKLHALCAEHPVVFHNAMADIPILKKNLGIPYHGYKQIDDTMLAHAVLWSELPHTLDFLESIYGQYGKFKHLQGTNELLYNYGDVVTTDLAWRALRRSLDGDTGAATVYRQQSIALIPILLGAEERGIRVNTTRVLVFFNKYQGVMKELRDLASLHVGYSINLNSGVQLKKYLYDERSLPLQISRKTKTPTTDDDAIALLRTIHGPVFDTTKEFTLDQDDEKHYSLLARLEAGAEPILECRALWASIWQIINNYIIGLANGVYGEDNDNRRRKARAKYWEAGLLSNQIVDRVRPNFAIHAQKNARWSTTKPPLAQLPSDMRDLVCPDHDEVCISWDWSAIEPRILQALTGSIILRRAFDEGIDLHTWTACMMFGYPLPTNLIDPHKSPDCAEWRASINWLGKEDPRRIFAKQGRYEMWYGGVGSNAAKAAAQFGLKPVAIRMALDKLLTSDPAYYAWRTRYTEEIKRTSIARTFMGRPRRFLSTGQDKIREALNYPMQGAVSDIFNTTVVMISQQFPELRWGWGMHDSQKWYVKREKLTQNLFNHLRSVVERARVINGQLTAFPADWEIIYPPEQDNLHVKPLQYFAQVS